MIEILVTLPRPKLTKVGIYYSRFEHIETENENDVRISEILQEFIQTNANLANFAIYVRMGNQDLKTELETLQNSIRSFNWDLNIKFEVVTPRISSKKY